MKNLFLVLIIVGAFFYLYHGWESSACEETHYYTIGEFDDRFGISQEDFVREIEGAEAVWEEEMDMNLFEYRPESEFAVNLIFDERQARTNEARRIEGGLEETQETISTISSEYQRLAEEYESRVSAYNASVGVYQADVESLNEEINAWNRRGGAPQSVYERLEREREELNQELNRLNRERGELEIMRRRVNSLGQTGNNLVEEYNRQVVTYNDIFGSGKAFDQGTYTGKAINIFQFETESELRLVLAHELGHTLGITHVENPRSLMYYLMGEQNLSEVTLTTEDREALTEVCGV